MKKNNNKFTVIFIGTILMTILLGMMIMPLIKSLNYGLDLKGGFEVLYQVHPTEGEKLTSEAVTATYKTIEKRINVLGVAEPEITVEGEDKIRVRLAGVTNQEEARNIMSKTASISFRDTYNNLLMNSEVLKKGSAKVTSYNGLPAVLLPISDNEKFFEVTNKVKDYPDDRLVIWLDFEQGVTDFKKEEKNCGKLSESKCLSAPSLNKQAFAGDVVISGNFTYEEASSLASLINSGSFPTKLEEISSRTVNASFGENSLDKTLIAGMIGILAIFVVMVLLYRFAGIVSCISIIIYTLLVFVLFYLIGGVLTLPGLAAVLLGIGMAVDACVISYERIKEELKRGKTVYQAFKLGNSKSLSSILDANITTFIVAVVLFIFGQSAVKGFATMLIVNIIVTVVTMVLINKTILWLFIKTKFFDNKLNLFIGVKKKDIIDINSKEDIKPRFKFNFINNYKKYLFGTLIIILFGCLLAFITGGLNLGIDFAGGSAITITANNRVSEENINQSFKELNYPIANIEKYDNIIEVRIKETLSKENSDKISSYFFEKYEVKTDIATVSQVVKKELTKNAVIALLIASVGIAIYVGIRFRFSYAISAIVALFHDVIAVIIFFGIFNIEINTIFIAAILAIVGYSINDTIVSFDRIRENFRKKHNRYVNDDQELKDLVNDSLNQTLTRTIYTSLTTLIPIVSLIFLGAFEIINFNIAMFIGLICGSYSSMFIASQLWTWIELRNIKKGPKAKKTKPKKEEQSELIIKGIND